MVSQGDTGPISPNQPLRRDRKRGVFAIWVGPTDANIYAWCNRLFGLPDDLMDADGYVMDADGIHKCAGEHNEIVDTIPWIEIPR